MAKVKKKENLTSEERLQAALVPDGEQPYKVPDNWCWTYLGNVSDVITGGTPCKKNPKYYGGTFPFFKPADLDFGRHVVLASEYLSDEGMSVSRIIPEQSTAVCCIGSIGKSGFLEVTGTTNQQINSAIPKFNPLYLYYFCNTNFFVDELWKKASATTISIVNKSKMESCIFPLPPFAEQQRIVDRIESLFAKLDEAKEKAQAALDSFETRKASILHKAFTGELTAQWRKENGVRMESWESLTLNDIAEYKKGPFGSSITKSMFVPKGRNTYKVYEQGNAIRKTVEYGHYYIEEQKYLELKTFSVNGGDIIISCAGTIGEVFKLPNNCARGIINQALMRVRIFSNIEEQFFIYYFGEILKGDVIDKANGTAIKNIPPFKIMKAMRIDLPSVTEQAEIVRILDDLLAKEQQAKEAAEAVLEQIDLIKKSILARAFRGELGTNDPAEESAVELLKQII